MGRTLPAVPSAVGRRDYPIEPAGTKDEGQGKVDDGGLIKDRLLFFQSEMRHRFLKRCRIFVGILGFTVLPPRRGGGRHGGKKKPEVRQRLIAVAAPLRYALSVRGRESDVGAAPRALERGRKTGTAADIRLHRGRQSDRRTTAESCRARLLRAFGAHRGAARIHSLSFSPRSLCRL